MNIEETLKRKVSMLEDMLVQAKEEQVKYPKGRINVIKGDTHPQYYYVPMDNEGKCSMNKARYLSKQEKDFAKQVVQRTYLTKIIKSGQKQIRILNKLLKDYKDDELSQIYENSCVGRKELITPYFISDEMYTNKWLSQDYQHKYFAEGTQEIFTEKGERVRSKSEKIIADILYKHGIPYLYEKPLELKGFGTVYPDFTILDIDSRREIYYEHFGMMDKPSYAEKAILKIKTYGNSGFFIGKNLLVSFETSTQQLNTKQIEDMLLSNINYKNNK